MVHREHEVCAECDIDAVELHGCGSELRPFQARNETIQVQTDYFRGGEVDLSQALEAGEECDAPKPLLVHGCYY